MGAFAWTYKSIIRNPVLFVYILISYKSLMVQRALKIVNNCLNTNIYSYLETSGGQSYNLHLNVVHFFIPVLIRHLWQLKTVVSCIGV
jgi:hypothetical protein